MDEKISAIALKSVDYMENDKLVSLYSAEYGRIVVIARGVKKATAKLKYATEPFCFGNFLLSRSHDRYVLTGCEQIESFYELRENVDKYYVGCVMLDIVSQIEIENQANPQVYLFLLKYLQQLLATDVPKIVLVKYLLDYLNLSGYKLNFDECATCHSRSFDRLYFDYNASGFVCPICRSVDSTVIPPAVLNTMRMIDNMPINKLHIVKVKNEYIKSALSILSDYYANTLSKIKSLLLLLEL